jgi:branched-chain amino acid aminotransferase
VIVWLDGRWLDADHATLSIRDRGFLSADGVYETGRLCDGGYFRLPAHLERLERSGAILGIPTPPAAELATIAYELAQRNAITDGSLRIIVTRGTGAGTTVLLTLEPVAPDWRARAARGWTLVTARTRRPPTESVPAQLKTLGRPYALLARREAATAGADDALLLSAAGDVAEGTAWNVFWRKGDRLCTPSLDAGVLDGITRTTLLEIAPAHGLVISEGRWPRSVLDDADELFATMSSLGIVPIRRLDDRSFDSAFPVVATLADAYWRTVAREAAVDRVRFLHGGAAS